MLAASGSIFTREGHDSKHLASDSNEQIGAAISEVWHVIADSLQHRQIRVFIICTILGIEGPLIHVHGEWRSFCGILGHDIHLYYSEHIWHLDALRMYGVYFNIRLNFDKRAMLQTY